MDDGQPSSDICNGHFCIVDGDSGAAEEEGEILSDGLLANAPHLEDAQTSEEPPCTMIPLSRLSYPLLMALIWLPGRRVSTFVVTFGTSAALMMVGTI